MTVLPKYLYEAYILCLRKLLRVILMSNLKEYGESLLVWWRALREVFFVCLMSVLPLGMSAAFDNMSTSTAFKSTLYQVISKGELFLFAISFAASAWLIASDSFPWQKKRPKSMYYLNIGSGLLYAICLVFIICQRLGVVFTNTNAVVRFSGYTFFASNLVLLFACKIRNVGFPKLSENDLKAGENDLLKACEQKMGGVNE